jgi:hypothetical protein
MAYKRTFVKDFAVNNPITTTLIVVVGGYVAYRGINRLITGGRNAGKKPLPVIPPVPVNPNQNKPNATQYSFGVQQYIDFADVLHAAMEPWGTDEKTIGKVLSQLKTYDDVLAVVDAYGKRTLDEWWGGTTRPLSLAQSFYFDMTTSEIDQYVNTPLKKTGYKF